MAFAKAFFTKKNIGLKTKVEPRKQPNVNVKLHCIAT